MLKNIAESEKFKILDPFLSEIFSTIKKDLKKEHFKADPSFFRAFFKGKLKQKITVAELKEVYTEQVLKGNNDLAGYLANKWISRHYALYEFFYRELASRYPDMEQIDLIEEKVAKELAATSEAKFGSMATYLFVIFNSVVFPEPTLNELRQKALEELQENG